MASDNKQKNSGKFDEFSAKSIRTVNKAKPRTVLLTPAHIALLETAARVSNMTWREYAALAVISQAKKTLSKVLPEELQAMDYPELYGQ